MHVVLEKMGVEGGEKKKSGGRLTGGQGGDGVFARGTRARLPPTTQRERSHAVQFTCYEIIMGRGLKYTDLPVLCDVLEADNHIVLSRE